MPVCTKKESYNESNNSEDSQTFPQDRGTVWQSLPITYNPITVLHLHETAYQRCLSKRPPCVLITFGKSPFGDCERQFSLRLSGSSSLYICKYPCSYCSLPKHAVLELADTSTHPTHPHWCGCVELQNV
eukprot:s49_g67.t1